MRHFFRLVFLALVLVAVALASAMVAMRVAIHGREVTVPKLEGMTRTEANRAISALGLRVLVERQFYSAEVAQGRILSQLPPPGTTVRRGWQVRVAESLGPQRVSIPDVTGQSQRAAELNIRRRGLEVGPGATVEIEGILPNLVITQNPPANANGVASPQISLLVSAPLGPQAFAMPSLVGESLANAKEALQQAGLRLGPVNPAAASDAASLSGDVVAAQRPAAGEKVLAGEVVNLQLK